MANADRSDSALDAATGAAGTDAAAAFTALGNETRLAILLALWEEYDPHGGENTVPFSDIFDRVAYEDTGNLRYHLRKLEGHFLTHDDAGYELRETGLTLVQTVIAGAGVVDETRDPTTVDESCPFCDAAVAVRYEDGLVITTCTACDGVGPETTDWDGFLSAAPFEPAGLDNRTPAEIKAASLVATLRRVQSLYEGLCPICSGAVGGWLDGCADHESDGSCDHCGMRDPVVARFECRVCKNHSVSPVQGLALFEPHVIAFYADHDVSTRLRADDLTSVTRVYDLLDDHDLALRSTDPPEATVTATRDGEQIVVTFDDRVQIASVERS